MELGQIVINCGKGIRSFMIFAVGHNYRLLHSWNKKENFSKSELRTALSIRVYHSPV